MQYIELLHRMKILSLTFFGTFIGSTLIFFVLLLDDEIGNYQMYYQSFFALFVIHFLVAFLPRIIFVSILVSLELSLTLPSEDLHLSMRIE